MAISSFLLLKYYFIQTKNYYYYYYFGLSIFFYPFSSLKFLKCFTVSSCPLLFLSIFLHYKKKKKINFNLSKVLFFNKLNIYYVRLKCTFDFITLAKVSIWSHDFFCCNFGPITFENVLPLVPS